MSEKIKKVKAADILAFAAKHNNKIHFKITNDGDLYPILDSVPVEVDPDTHKCSLSMGYYSYRMDDATHGIYAGDCEFEILGVRFSTPYDSHDSFSTDGNEIDYGEMDEDEFWEELQNLIDIPLYDCFDDAYEFDADSVSNMDLVYAMECEYSVFAIDKDGSVCAFDDESEIPGYKSGEDTEYKIIDRDKAFRILAERDGPGLDFDLG